MPYKVDVLARIKELTGGWDHIEISQDGEFSYSFAHGREIVTLKYSEDTGTSSFDGIYHPNVVCEGGGACTYCGRTL